VAALAEVAKFKEIAGRTEIPEFARFAELVQRCAEGTKM
jgi:hypothetical protein